MQPWDSVLINANSNDANKGRAGCVVSVDMAANPPTVTIRLDPEQDGTAGVIAKSNQSDVTRLG